MASETGTRRRVKLYMLNENRVWDDQGTGHVSSVPTDKVSKGLSLVVRSEVDGKVLLESKIQMNTAYQKQQETLIVWSEVDNFDYALSFQDKAGCDEIWEKICEVQGKDPSVEITQDIIEPESEDMEDDRFDEIHDATTSSLELPPCELSRLDEIAELFSSSLLTPIKREKLALSIENEGYIKRLVELFHICEDLENTEGLHRLYSIFKAMFLLNKTALFELLFTDELIIDVIGVLEYDPSAPQPARHREYIQNQSQLKQVIPLSNTDLVKKIHQTYRVQYIQDIILPMPSMFEENLLSTLNSFVYFNKMEIVTMIQEDENFLKSLFKQLTDDEVDDSARRDLILFLKEFCTFSQTLTQQNREAFFKVLSNLGILNTLEAILGLDDCSVKSLAVDIFSFIVEFNPSIVREFVLLEAQSQEDEDLLINMILEQLTTDTDPELGGAMQLMGTIRLLIDPENMVSTMQKTEKAEFLQFFYPHCMHVLTAPLFANTVEERPAKDDYQTAQLLSLILELLTFCVEHHTYHVKTYVMSKNLLRRVLVLLKSRHSFLNLAALRMLRRMVGLKDEFYNRYIIKHDLLKPVVDAFVDNGSRYNLFNSAIIELFEFIRTEDIKSLVSYVVEKHFSAFESVTYVQTFKVLKQRFEQQQDRLMNKPDSLDGLSPMLRNSRYQRDTRMLDEEEEEMWFEQDEDLDDTDLVPKLDSLRGKLDLEYKPSKLLTTNKANESGVGGAFTRRSPPRSLTKSISINISTTSVTAAAAAAAVGSPVCSPAPTPASSPDMPISAEEKNTAPPVSQPSFDDKTDGSESDTDSIDKEKTSEAAATSAAAAAADNGSSSSSLSKGSGAGGLVGLVDYPDEDSDEEEVEEATEERVQTNEEDSEDGDVLVPASKRPRLST